MSLRKELVRKLIDYRLKNRYTTYALRKIERAKERKPIAGINVTTLNFIEKDPSFCPSRGTIIELCNFLELDYYLDDFGNPQMNSNEV
jgi:hypothetical protein|tara:strand:+ start:85 stop:348 length:264 start_codon:yes stop_codon:yes gene_type:complete